MVSASILCMSKSAGRWFSEQISLNVRMVLTVVMRMQTVLILMVATPALVHLDSLEMD